MEECNGRKAGEDKQFVTQEQKARKESGLSHDKKPELYQIIFEGS